MHAGMRLETVLFDDSWEHEVHNECSSERVVFQVVIRHPELHSNRRDGSEEEEDPRTYTPVVMDAH